MTDRPIIFSAPMVRALLAGRKTMTRRLVPYGSVWMRVQAGDHLWVREALKLTGDWWRYAADDRSVSLFGDDARVSQMVGWAHHQEREHVSPIHMPRWASRLTLIVTATRIERLHDITPDDCLREGIPPITDESAWTHPIPREPNLPAIYGGAFCKLWCDLHGDDAWDDNPEVVAITFTVHQINIMHCRGEIAA
jgi:hypothetical protein